MGMSDGHEFCLTSAWQYVLTNLHIELYNNTLYEMACVHCNEMLLLKIFQDYLIYGTVVLEVSG
jgi:hypothetical protein